LKAMPLPRVKVKAPEDTSPVRGAAQRLTAPLLLIALPPKDVHAAIVHNSTVALARVRSLWRILLPCSTPHVLCPDRF
jgi:hypothetical protein